MEQKYIDNFWKKVNKGKKADECWEWTGALQKNGYGNMSIGKRSPLGAHRISWIIHYGSIPKGMYVCHHCDNRKCVNPKHLFIGTHKDNLADMRMKGRSQRGKRNGSCKLTRKQIREIRTLLRDGYTQAQISDTYRISQSQVYRIKVGQKWGWLK